MCIICLSMAVVGTAAVAIDKKYNSSKVANSIKNKVFNDKKKIIKIHEKIMPNTSSVF